MTEKFVCRGDLMCSQINNTNIGSELRRKAEVKVASRQAVTSATSDEMDAKRLLHELQVHHEELKMQAEELLQTKSDLERFNVTLEEQVASRNKELSAAITNLQEEVTNCKQAEESNYLLQQQFQQAQKLESLGVLAGGIAHDFNNLLTIIISNCSLVKQQPHKTGDLLPEIERAAYRAADLCRQMLAYAGKSVLSVKQVNMAVLVDDMFKMLRASISQNVLIRLNFLGNLPCIKGDATQLRQIVMNLIINAAEAIGEGQGLIKVSLSKAEITSVNPVKDHLGKVIPAGEYLCLEVTDNGCGMDDATKQRIFEPFFTTKFTGRGLGMSALLGIITAHKGMLQLVSQPYQGTTFKIFLPAQINVPDEESLQRKTQAAWKGSGTILLVEDERSIELIAGEIMKDLGFSVIAASNGKEALELYQKNAADITLVVTDIGMPLMNGYELLRELKKLNPDLPIIVSSGFGDTEVTSRIPPADIAGLVSKPYNYDQLRDTLKGALAGTHPTGAA